MNSKIEYTIMKILYNKGKFGWLTFKQLCSDNRIKDYDIRSVLSSLYRLTDYGLINNMFESYDLSETGADYIRIMQFRDDIEDVNATYSHSITVKQMKEIISSLSDDLVLHMVTLLKPCNIPVVNVDGYQQGYIDIKTGSYVDLIWSDSTEE
jgi:hypothetical protein